jgi:glycosyltransferase involved in cell wall biosynthesis
MSSINVFHKTEQRRHHEPIIYLSKIGRFDNISFFQYSMRHAPEKVLTNVRFLASALYNGIQDPIILGAEPFDFRVDLFKRLANKNQVIYHTSWPFWNGTRVPRDPLFEIQRERWKDFLQEVKTVAVTETARKAVNEFGGSAIHIPHSVNTKQYSPTKKIDTNKQNILFVGRIVESKGISDLLTAVENMNLSPVVQFVGQGPQSHILNEYNGSVDVEYLGYIDDEDKLAELYASADIHVLPSYAHNGWEELFGIVIIEAMAAGTPTVATDCVGPSEIVLDGETGILVPQRDPTTLSTALDSLLENNERRQKMGQYARSVAVDKYSVSKIANKWNDII